MTGGSRFGERPYRPSEYLRERVIKLSEWARKSAILFALLTFFIEFYTKWGPQPYTVNSWDKERTYGLSVRPIKDKEFKTNVGITVISNSDQSPYRDTRASRRRR